jgi:hypothetical protein
MSAGRDLWRALAVLVALGLATTAIAALRDGAAAAWPAAAAAALLVLAGLEAEIILARYLALRVAPAWLRGFRAALVLLLSILYALWLIPLLP